MIDSAPIIKIRRLDKRTPDAYAVSSFQSRAYSQAGEDGIISRIFDVIGTRNRWCVDIGAGDGARFSNTAYLLRCQKWSGVLIESGSSYQDLERFYCHNSNVHLLNEKATEAIEDMLSAIESLPRDFDFLSIDIDGMDYYIWESMHNLKPRCVVIEFNHRVPNDIVFVQARDHCVRQGASLAALIELGKRKGYELVCVHHWNAFFVQSKYLTSFGLKANDIDSMHCGPPGRIWETYDGTIYQTLGRTEWTLKAKGHESIDNAGIQLLRTDERSYDTEDLGQEAVLFGLN